MTARPFEVFLLVRAVHSRRYPIQLRGYRSEWLTRTHQTTMYRSGLCPTREEAQAAAERWLSKQPGGRFVDDRKAIGRIDR
jgi:hypothetical protein